MLVRYFPVFHPPPKKKKNKNPQTPHLIWVEMSVVHLWGRQKIDSSGQPRVLPEQSGTNPQALVAHSKERCKKADLVCSERAAFALGELGC